MRKVISYLTAVLLCIALGGTAAAESAFVPELETWDWTSQPVKVTLSADVQTHMPYDDVRVQQLNALLRHMSLKLHFQQMADEQWSTMSLMVDDAEILAALQREKEDSVEAQFSVQPYSAYVWDKNGEITLNSMLGGEAAGELWLDGSETAWLDDALALMDAVTVAMPEQLSDKPNKVEIAGFGQAVRKQTLIIPKSSAGDLNGVLAGLCAEGELRSLLQGMVFSGTQTLTLWRDETGAILQANWSGNAGASTEDLREVSLAWKLCRNESLVRDELTLRTPRVKGSGRNNLILSRQINLNGDQAAMKMDITRNTLKDGVKTVIQAAVNLERMTENGRSHVTGDIDMNRQIGDNGDVDRILLQPDITFTGTADEPAAGGQAVVSRYQNKKLQEQATIALAAERADWMLWELRSSPIRVDESNAAVVAQRIVDGMTVDLVRRLVLLPQEDTLFLSADLDPLVWQQIVEAAQSALQ